MIDEPVDTSTAMLDKNQPNSVQVMAKRTHSNLQPFDRNIYPHEQAKNLDDYSEFIQGQPRAKTPEHLASTNKNKRNFDLVERKKLVENGGMFGGGVELADMYGHVKIKKKDDFDRAFRLIGVGGDFSEVRYHIPDENVMILDDVIGGPATGRHLARQQAERQRLDLAIMANETDKEKKQRKLKESADRKAARRRGESEKEDWRKTKDPNTRQDTDFMTEIETHVPKVSWKKKDENKSETENKKLEVFSGNIGPKTRKIDYDEIDKVQWREICKNRIPVREQLANRMVEEKVWDVEGRGGVPIEENVYLRGLSDDRLEQFKQQVRDQKLEEAMEKYTSQALDLVSKRKALIR